MCCAIDLFSKYPLVVSLKGKNVITIVYAFQSIKKGKREKRKANKIWLIKLVNFLTGLSKNR